MTWPYHLRLLSSSFSQIDRTLILLWIWLFWISDTATPPAHLDIPISVTSSLSIWSFLNGQQSAPYVIADHTDILQILPLISLHPYWLFSQRIMSLHFNHLILIQFVISVFKILSIQIDLKNLKFVSFSWWGELYADGIFFHFYKKNLQLSLVALNYLIVYYLFCIKNIVNLRLLTKNSATLFVITLLFYQIAIFNRVVHKPGGS